jgi:hypothetical protein
MVKINNNLASLMLDDNRTKGLPFIFQDWKIWNILLNDVALHHMIRYIPMHNY